MKGNKRKKYIYILSYLLFGLQKEKNRKIVCFTFVALRKII